LTDSIIGGFDMAILDCESFESILSSVSEIFKISSSEIRIFISKVNQKNWNHNRFPYFEDYLFTEISKLSESYPKPIGVYWFHLTRTWRSNKFADGILPLKEGINSIWLGLHKLAEVDVTIERWINFRRKVESTSTNRFADMYRMKLANSIHGGPFAMLVRDVAFIPKVFGNHDYC
jgi:hypothetical protein